MGQSLCYKVCFLVIFMNPFSSWVSWSGKETLLTLAKYSEDFLAFWNYKSMYLWNINWSNAQHSPFLGPDYGRSLIPTAVKSLFACVMFCLINKKFCKVWVWAILFPQSMTNPLSFSFSYSWSKPCLTLVISTPQYYSFFLLVGFYV